MVTAPASVLDTKPYVEWDADVGYRYRPSCDLKLPRPGGGTYHLSINEDGVRSSRRYTRQKPEGYRRFIVLGDSFAAGQFVSNDHRFTEILERKLPGTEFINLALEGTGTDQQLLIYEKQGPRYEHDAVLLLPFLQNIRRNLVDARVAFDPLTGKEVLRPKPRFELNPDGTLRLKTVANEVTDLACDEPGGESGTSDRSTGAINSLKTRLSSLPLASLLKRIIFRLRPWEPFPEYQDPNGHAWKLMTAILQRLKLAAGTRPLFIIPVFYDSYVKYRMALNYLDRFRSLESAGGIHVVDLLPHFQQHGRDAPRCFQIPHDCHWSAVGHLTVAEALAPTLLDWMTSFPVLPNQ